MFRNQQNTSLQATADLSVKVGTSLDILLFFIHGKINGFRGYYLNSDKPEKEESLNTLFVRYYNSLLLTEESGNYPYIFEKHPATDDSQHEPDFCVAIANPSIPQQPIFELEAKRLSSNISSNHQYVCGQNRGAIERFKKRMHGKHINSCGVIGYVQTNTCKEWFDKINEWIDVEIRNSNETNEIIWKLQDKLSSTLNSVSVLYATSNSQRIDNTNIEIFHYLIDLKE